MRKTCLDEVYRLAKADPRIVFIGSDLGVGTLAEFQRDMPDRFFMEGVSEALLIGMAAGLAMEGRVVYVNTIATFLTRRCFEQITLDLGLHKLPVRLIANGGGLVYTPLGPTHEAIDDVALMRTVPGMHIFAPADAEEMRRLVPETVDLPGPAYIRLGKGGDPVVTEGLEGFQVGRAYVMREGADLLLATTGILLKTALDAADLLAKEGVETAVLHLPTLKPLDEAALLARAAQVPAVLTLEEHSRIGGLGSAVAELLAEAGLPRMPRFKRLALPDAYPDRYGSQASLLARYGLAAPEVAAAARNLLAARV